MEPRKKDFIDYAFPIIGVIVVLFISLHMAMAYENMKDDRVIKSHIDENGNEVIDSNKFNYGKFLNELGNELSKNTDSIKFVDSTPKFFGGGCLVCFLIFGYIYTSKKKYINGKEYGTSEWATQGLISHLRSMNLKKSTIKSIKKNKNFSTSRKKKKIEEAKKKYNPNSDIIFTQTEKISMYNFELNNNTMIIGGSGSGKTRGYVLPNILQCCNGEYSPSIVVTDPKGEILAKIGKYLTDCGYEIKVLNLKEQNRSFCFNPFKYILEVKYEESISSLVECIMNSKTDIKTQKSNDPFWEDMAKVLLKSIFYAVYEGFPIEQQNMSTVMEMFRWFEVSDEDNRNTQLDKFFDVFGDKYGTYHLCNKIRDFYMKFFNENSKLAKTYSLAPQYPMDIKSMGEHLYVPINGSDNSCGGILQYEDEIVMFMQLMEQEEISDEVLQRMSIEVREAIHTYIDDRQSNYSNSNKPVGVVLFEKYGDINTNPALRNWEDFRTKCKGKTAQSVTATALSKLSPFDEEQIRRIFSKDEMELDLVGERKTALFIVLPPTNKTYNFIANVLYTQLFEQLEYCATVKHNQQLPVPVRFILDEFYNTGRIPNFENILSYARSFGMGISIILQSLDQIKEMYEKSWGTVLDNCSTFLYLGGIRHFDTLKYISDLLGKGTFDKKSYSRTKGRQSSSSVSEDKIGRELLDPAEIQKLDKKKCLFFVSGYNPYLSRKFNYTTHKNYKYTSDFNKKNLFHYESPVNKKINCEVTQGENISNSVTDFKPIQSELININLDEDNLIKYLNDNLIYMDINNTSDMALSNDEYEEYQLIQNILKGEEKKTKDFNAKVLELLTPTTKESDIQEICNEFNENIDNVSVIESDNVLIEELEDVEDSLNILSDEMADSGFLDNLNNIDIDDLDIGIMNDVEKLDFET